MLARARVRCPLESPLSPRKNRFFLPRRDSPALSHTAGRLWRTRTERTTASMSEADAFYTAYGVIQAKLKEGKVKTWRDIAGSAAGARD